MFRIALIGTISVVILLAVGSVAYARGVGRTPGDGYTLNVTSHAGRMITSDTITSDGAMTMPGSSETMASHISQATTQMRARYAQVHAATNMQPATGMDPVDPGYGMQSGNMGSTTGTGTGTSGGSAGSGDQMGSPATGNHTGSDSSSMMGSGSGSRMGM